MTERSIIMSAESIASILDGSKWQARRVIAPQPQPWDGWQEESVAWNDDLVCWTLWQNVRPGKQRPIPIKCPYSTGTHLWVKETWTPAHGEPRWSSPLFMPKARARLWLAVTGVRVARLQDITPAGLAAEGYAGQAWMFEGVWNELNAKRGYGWDSNPWVWVIEFRRIEP